MKQLIKLRYLVSIALVLAPAFSWAMGPKPSGYIPDCNSVVAECKGEQFIPELALNADGRKGGCGPGELRIMRFDSIASREQLCVKVSFCGGSLLETYGLCQEYENNVIRYKCLRFGGYGSSACPR